MRARSQFNLYLGPEYIQQIRDEAERLETPIGQVIELMWDTYHMDNIKHVVRQFIRRVSGRQLPMDQRQYLERMHSEIEMLLASQNKPGNKA